MTRTAVVLFNLGGPDSLRAVRPYLRNLFSDPAIIGLPAPFRQMLATYIAFRRNRVAINNYAKIGGASPLLPETEAQARALEKALSDLGDLRVFIAMRHWHPRLRTALAAIKSYGPRRIVLLPLYPQYSTTTTGSSLAEWRQEIKRAGIAAKTRTICCYPRLPGFAAALAGEIRAALDLRAAATKSKKPRVLFSAHGLPLHIAKRGDPYPWQIETTVKATVELLNEPGLDWVICYQSRVGSLPWLTPATEDEIFRAGRDGVPVIVVPVAFVSEHSETLVELDIDYRARAEAAGVPSYVRLPTVGTNARFIQGLAEMVRGALNGEGLASAEGGRLCPAVCRQCAMQSQGAE